MRDPYVRILYDPDGMSLSQELEAALNSYRELVKAIDEAFRQPDLSETVTETVKLKRHTEKLTGQLSYLRMNLGSLKSAFQTAFAPIGALVLPAINSAIVRLRSFLHTVAAVAAAVTENIFGTEHLARANEDAADSYKGLSSSAKKALAAFDQIQRLGSGSGSGGSRVYDPTTVITEDMRAAANRVLQFLRPILNIDFGPVKTAFQNLWAAAKPALEKLGQTLSWLWQAVAAPFISWCVQTLLPTLADLLTGAVTTLTNTLGPLIDGLKILWSALQPVVEFIRNSLITTLQNWQSIFGELAAQTGEKGNAIATVFYGLAQVISTLWSAIEPKLENWKSRFSEVFSGIGRVVAQVITGLTEGLAGVTEFLAGLFTGDWKRAWNGIVLILKSAVNSLIGLLNTMLVKLTSSLNSVARLASQVKFTVPKWVPGIGGETYQIPMKTFTAPQIPYLAKGAVLPANRPFLAMVGDQKHGTNIEAPLATIQQAVATTMDAYAGANLAGHNATVSVLKDILEAVLGIEIGDETIARSADRYRARMAVVTGG